MKQDESERCGVSDDEALEIVKMIRYFVARNKNMLKFFDSYDDMIEDLVLQVFKRIKNYDCERGKLSTFVAIVCKTACLMQIRHQRSQSRNFETINFTTLENGQSVVEFVENKRAEQECWQVGRLDKFMSYLAEETKMHYIDDLSLKEIGRRLGTSSQAVAQRIQRNKTKLREKFKEKIL